MRLNRLSVVFVSALSLPLVACGGDDGGGGGVIVPDAKVFMDAAIDAPPACSIEMPSITAVPSAQNGAVLDLAATQTRPAQLNFRMVFGPSDTTSEWLEFSHNKPVTINMDINLANGCAQGGAYCMLLLGNITIANNMLSSEQVFLARSGTIRITEAGNAGGTFKATITNAMFKRYMMGSGGLVDAMDTACTATIATMTIDMPVTAPMMATGKQPLVQLPAQSLRIAE